MGGYARHLLDKIERFVSVPGTKSSFNLRRFLAGTSTSFVTTRDVKPVRCIIDWSLCGILGMREEYKNCHYYIADHAVEGCELNSFPDAWPTP